MTEFSEYYVENLAVKNPSKKFHWALALYRSILACFMCYSNS